MTAIDDRQAALGGDAGFLGAPTSAEESTADGRGQRRHYAAGSIYVGPAGPVEVHGQIRERWVDLHAELGPLGLPVSDELPTPDGRGRFSRFEHGGIYWTELTGAHAVFGTVLDAWGERGWEGGALGFPISSVEQTACRTGEYACFEHGSLHVYRRVADEPAGPDVAMRPGREAVMRPGARVGAELRNAILVGAVAPPIVQHHGRIGIGFLAVRSRVLDLGHGRPLRGAHVTVEATLRPLNETLQAIGRPLDETFTASAPGLSDDEGFVALLLAFPDIAAHAAVLEGLGIGAAQLDLRVAVRFRDLEVRSQTMRLAYPVVPDPLRSGTAPMTYDLPLVVDLGAAIVGHTTPTSTLLWFAPTSALNQSPGHRVEVELIDLTTGEIQRQPLPIAPQLGHPSTVTFGGLTPGRSHRFLLRDHLPGELGPGYALLYGTVATPVPTETTLTVAFGSCHTPTHGHSLERWEQLERESYDLLWLIGDQIYEYGMAGHGQDDYANRYLEYWRYAAVRRAMTRGPVYMVQDDHETQDDFAGTTRDAPRAQVARAAYLAFQQAHNPPLLATTSIDTHPPALHYAFTRGPAAFFALDHRTRKGLEPEFPILGSQQLADLEAWAASPETLAADIIFLAAPMPLAWLPANDLVEAVKQLVHTANAAGASVGALVALGIAAIAGGGIGVGGALAGAIIGASAGAYAVGRVEAAILGEDTWLTATDLGDHWTYQPNRVDLLRVLQILRTLSEAPDVSGQPRRRAIFVLSGDVHVGGLHELRATADGELVAMQVTSSPISRTPALGWQRNLFGPAVLHLRPGLEATVGVIVEAIEGEVEEIVSPREAATLPLDADVHAQFESRVRGVVPHRNFGRIRITRPAPTEPYTIDIAIEGRDDRLHASYRFDPTTSTGLRWAAAMPPMQPAVMVDTAYRHSRVLAAAIVDDGGRVRVREQRGPDSIFWSAWMDLGCPHGAARSLALAEDGAGRLVVVTVGQDARVWVRFEGDTERGEPWSPWLDVGGCMRTVAADRTAAGNVAIAAIGEDAQLNFLPLRSAYGHQRDLPDRLWQVLPGAWHQAACGRGRGGALVVAALDQAAQVFVTHEQGDALSVVGQQLAAPQHAHRTAAHVALGRGPAGLASLLATSPDGTWHCAQRAVGGWSDWDRAGPGGDEVTTAPEHDERLLVFVRGGDGVVHWVRQGRPVYSTTPPPLIVAYGDWSEPRRLPLVDTHAVTMAAGRQAAHLSLYVVTAHGVVRSFDQTTHNGDTLT